MSERNGDKARFGRRRKQKLLRRKHHRVLQKSLESQRQAAEAQETPKSLVFVG
jgi:hypothetical protein